MAGEPWGGSLRGAKRRYLGFLLTFLGARKARIDHGTGRSHLERWTRRTVGLQGLYDRGSAVYRASS